MNFRIFFLLISIFISWTPFKLVILNSKPSGLTKKSKAKNTEKNNENISTMFSRLDSGNICHKIIDEIKPIIAQNPEEKTLSNLEVSILIIS